MIPSPPLEFGLKRHGPAKDADLAKVLLTDEHGLIGRVFGPKDDTLFGDVDSLEGNLVVDEHHGNFAVLDSRLAAHKHDVPIHNSGILHTVSRDPEAKVDPDAVIAELDVVLVALGGQNRFPCGYHSEDRDTLRSQSVVIFPGQD